MNLEGHTQPAEVQAIYDHYKSQRKNDHRPHLGGSQIGNECSRALWYQFRWAWSPDFDGRILRLFETGDREEGRVVRNLKDIGLEVWEVDPETGKQIHASAHGGHFGLSLDGVVRGLKESSQPHVFECKTMNTKGFKQLKAKGVQEAKPIYWAQMQVGMHLCDLERALFVTVCKETDEIYMERVRLDKAAAIKLVAKAGQIIFSEEPPAKLNEDPAFYLCKFCSYAQVCHGGKVPEVNCRTCAHATPEADGTWNCRNEYEEVADQGGCNDHLFNPSMMPWAVDDAGSGWVDYMRQDGEIISNAGNSREISDAESA
jgi:hypothetical protein